MKLFIILLIISFSAMATEWKLSSIQFKDSKIRTGILKTSFPLKGNIIYLEGLGDSMLNHRPLFNHLNNQGFNVITFDYMGQGGSTGSMNNTTIKNIGELTKLVWKTYTGSNKDMNLLGWSTGGLASYALAYYSPKQVKQICLIAPGISPKVLVGETSLKNKSLLKITEQSLTQKLFTQNNPHVDPIKPNSPLLVPLFSSNLLMTSIHSQSWKISKSIKGLVLLSSDEDTYVNARKTIEVLKKNAKHFDYFQYAEGSLHELDNEIDSVSQDVHLKVSNFFE